MNTIPDEVRKHRLTVADFQAMEKAGLFMENNRVELINGEIFDMAPIGIPHTRIVNQLTERLVLATQGTAMVSVQNSMVMGDFSQPQPDICLFRRREDFYADALPSNNDVLLVIEVSDTTLKYDRDFKVGFYASHAVPEVWLFDIQNNRLLVFHDLESGDYQHTAVLKDLECLAPQQLQDVSVDVSGLF